MEIHEIHENLENPAKSVEIHTLGPTWVLVQRSKYRVLTPMYSMVRSSGLLRLLFIHP